MEYKVTTCIIPHVSYHRKEPSGASDGEKQRSAEIDDGAEETGQACECDVDSATEIGGGTEKVEERSGATRRRTGGDREEAGCRGGDRRRREGSGGGWEGISEVGVGVPAWFGGGVASLAAAAAEKVEENGRDGESVQRGRRATIAALRETCEEGLRA
uniref:DUF834 domain-containing protein n=1 Tax=Oryza meridionalis TaxID=40149 RepID=A0A0E0F3J9_9ORYZ